MTTGIIETDYAATQAEAARLTALADDAEAIAHACIEAAETLAADQASWAKEWKPEGVHQETTAKLADGITTVATQAQDLAESIRSEARTLERRVADAIAVDEENAAALDEVDTQLTTKRPLGN
ncbi:hypothetical protein [Mycobacteroides franklinii]|uniref:Uncharacterized protein n=1 Tax=Mycobacteroides franklinii TaxID=948102 RepID=A0A4V3A6K1_9MYCO|nr:hypothetical protein [Mycobacteroides franklinii]ORA54181.1 hypothetical protein BST24_26985 [Mycobacteroides franklinii]TDH23879.1 hypothetical protein EJ571_06475 [Mycobacteroides franklinii]